MKKGINLFLGLVLGITCTLTSACGHVHTYSTEYQKDAIYHWQICLDENCQEESEKVNHVYDNQCDTTCDCGNVRRVFHDFGDEYQFDDNYHWVVCKTEGCDEISEKEEHVYGIGEIYQQPTSTQEGLKKYTCQSCGNVKFGPLKPTIQPNDSKDIADDVVVEQKSFISTTKYNDYASFNEISEARYIVPGLKDYVPQGMDYWDEENLLLISAYPISTKTSPTSMIFAVDVETGALFGKYCIKNANNTNHTSHVGGIAVTTKNLFISADSQLLRIPLSQFYTAGTSGVLKIVETINVPVRASYCNYSGGKLWVGDFYLSGSSTYTTPDWRHMVSNDGSKYGSWAVGYTLADTESEFTTDNWDKKSMQYATPDVIYSTRDSIQGFAVVNDSIVLSKSYGRNAKSSLYVYKVKDNAHKTVKVNEKDVPLWFLDSNNNVKTYVTLPMSEGLAECDGKLLVLYESGSEKYRSTGTHPTDRVWEVKLP